MVNPRKKKKKKKYKNSGTVSSLFKKITFPPTDRTVLNGMEEVVEEKKRKNKLSMLTIEIIGKTSYARSYFT